MIRACAWVARVVVTAIALVWFFRQQVRNRFSVLFGDPDDAVITTSLIEHWHRVFAGLDHWNRVPYFAPYPDTLGYGEGFLLLGVLAAPLRVARVDPFVAAELATLLMRGVGGVCFAVLAQRVFRLSVPASLLGAFLVTAAGNALVQADHAQLATTMLLPPLALLIADVMRAAAKGDVGRAAARACAAMLLLDAWLLTAFYTAWFAILFLLLMLLAAVACCLIRRTRLRWPVAGSSRSLLPPAVLAVVVGLAGAIPFLLTYLPRLSETGMHDFLSIRPAMPTLPGLLNDRLGFGLTGRLPHAVAAAIARGNVDPAGYGPLLLLLALAGLWLGMAGVRRVNLRAVTVAVPRAAPEIVPGAVTHAFPGDVPSVAPGAADGAAAAILWLSLGLATLVCLLLVTSVPAWHMVYRLVPGAGVVRAPARFLLLLSMPLVLLAMLALDRSYQHFGRRSLPVLLLVALALVAEDRASPPVGMPRAPGDQLLARLAPAPGVCRSFFVTGRDPDGWHTADDAPNYRHNADAMFVAVMTGLPTINGYSTFNPPDWDFADVDAPDYPDRVGKYAAAHELSPFLCRLDLSRHRWIVDPVLPVPAIGIGQTVSLSHAGPLDNLYTLTGWGSPEENGRWTVSDHASLRFLLPDGAARETLRFAMHVSALMHGAADASERVRIVANGRSLGSVSVGAAPGDVGILVPAGTVGPDGALTITLQQPPLRTPRALGIAPDDRHLGLYVWWLRIDRS